MVPLEATIPNDAEAFYLAEMSIGIGLSLIIVVLFTIPSLVGRISEHMEERRAALRNLIALKGWRLDETAAAATLTIEGETDDVKWRMVSQNRSNKGASTTWTSSDVVYPKLLMAIRTRRSFDFLSGRLSKMLVAISARAPADGSDWHELDDLINNSTGLQATTPLVAERYVVLVRNGATNCRLTPELERALSYWFNIRMQRAFAETLTVDVGTDGVRVSCSFRIRPDQLDRIVDIGVQTALAVRA